MKTFFLIINYTFRQFDINWLKKSQLEKKLLILLNVRSFGIFLTKYFNLYSPN